MSSWANTLMRASRAGSPFGEVLNTGNEGGTGSRERKGVRYVADER